jgi:hypothetical protein
MGEPAMNESVEVRLELPRAALDEEKAAASGTADVRFGSPKAIPTAAEGLGKAHFIEPVSLTVTLTLAWIAKRMVDHWLKDREAGVQFDLRTTPATVSRVAGVPAGFIVLIDRDGKASTRQAKYDKPEDLLPHLQEILVAGSGDK